MRIVAGARLSTCVSRRSGRSSATPSRRRASTRCAGAPSSWAGPRRRLWWSTRTPVARAVRSRVGSGSASWSPRLGSGRSGSCSRWRSRGSRGARADWHQLLDLCALTATLIADSDGVYSPANFNDRLLLGLKGTMSEAELHLIRARLDGGLRNKAARGELRLALPVGLDRDEDARIVLSPDEQVRHAIERVFC